jgi:ubiquinone/menaquinone biosynthesis C-methylase UbiE
VAILEHLSDLTKALSEIRRVLKKEGGLIVLIPTENFIYRLGRAITVKKYMEKKFNIDYDKLVKEEHVNECGYVMKELKKHFTINKIVGVPFLIPLISINIFMVIRCELK